MTFQEALREVEIEEVRAACRLLCLPPDVVAAVLRWHFRDSSMLPIYHAIGGSVLDYVEAKAQCVRAIRARSGLWEW